MMEIFKIAGLAGLALWVFFIIFKRIIEKISSTQISKAHTYKILRLIIIITGIIAIVGIGTWAILQILNRVSPDTDVTVFVHGKKGKQDFILRQKGSVIMDVNNERRSAPIDDKGEAIFKNIHVGDSVQLEIDFSEPYRSLNPDSIYIIKPKSKLYFGIALQGIDKVRGVVLFKDFPLEGVIVKIDSLSTVTDQIGNFNLNIPENLQQNNYTVWFIKKGFKTKKTTSYPETGEALEMIMEK